MPGAPFAPVRLQDLVESVSLTSEAQGDLLFRGANRWNNLPAGAVGRPLITGGTGANPSWAEGVTLTGKSLLVGTGIVNVGTGGEGVIVLGNSAAPTTQPADLVQLFASDYSAGDSRLLVWSESGQGIWIGNNRIEAKAPGSGGGTSITIRGSNAVSGSSNGGDSIFQCTSKSGVGRDGRVAIRLATSSPGGTSFEIQKSDGTGFIKFALTSPLIQIDGLTINDVLMNLNGLAGQADDLQRWQVNGTTVCKINKDGNPTAKSTYFFEDANGYISRTAAGNTMDFSPSGATGILKLTANNMDVLCSGGLRLRRDTDTTDGEISTVNKGGNSGIGLGLLVHAGNGSTGGTPTAGGYVKVYGGSGAAGNVNGGAAYLFGGAKFGSGLDGDTILGYTGSAARGNVALFGAGSFGGGANVLFIGNCATAPTTAITGGGGVYIEAGALKYIGSSGTITTLAPA